MIDPSALEALRHPLRGLCVELHHPRQLLHHPSSVLRYLSTLDPLLDEKLTFLPPRLTPWLLTTELRIPSAENRLPLTDYVTSTSALHRPTPTFMSSLCLVLSGNSFSQILTAPLLQDLLN